MDTGALAQNLRRLRDEKGLTQGQVAEKAGISRVAYRNIETGAAEPREGTLTRLADALGVKIPDLMVEVRALQAVRFRQKRMTSREQVLVRVARWLEAYRELEGLLGEEKEFAFARAKARAQPTGRERSIKAAASARHCAKLEPKDPIRDVCELLEDNGVKVYPLVVANEGFFGLSVAKDDGGPAVVVNVWDRISVERWIFTAAHELGHLLLHAHAYRVDDRDENKAEEKEADVFAAHFLMPPEVFDEAWRETRGLSFLERVLKAKRLFRVSYRTVLHRVQDTTSLGKTVWGRFQAEYKAQYGRVLAITEESMGLKLASREPAPAEPHSAHEPERLTPHEFNGDRLKLLVREAIEQEKISLNRGAEILGLDLADMRKLAASWVE
jgi:Zn-dependent peptidase ImmA (M78 family)/DNA-binding XRE family transcriptional regulator